jgi:hypothetical protein
MNIVTRMYVHYLLDKKKLHLTHGIVLLYTINATAPFNKKNHTKENTY